MIERVNADLAPAGSVLQLVQLVQRSLQDIERSDTRQQFGSVVVSPRALSSSLFLAHSALSKVDSGCSGSPVAVVNKAPDDKKVDDPVSTSDSVTHDSMGSSYAVFGKDQLQLHPPTPHPPLHWSCV
ncbi:hypothetical protein JOB18_019480 [Solea senegalensis]|uniref:Uncharacterized protein n=1 Tax=Solea senegalensis TaxID=28829 RepID=A0AAV6QTZ5_SOLSE|nr:hypothetical protein JOB18_019480 [Solea senegalensis]